MFYFIYHFFFILLFPADGLTRQDGSRNKTTTKLRGAAAKSKKRKRDGTEEDETRNVESFPTGQYIDDRNTRGQHVRRHKHNLTEQAKRLSAECGWSISIVATPPESATKTAQSLEISLPDKNGRNPPPPKNMTPFSKPPLLIERGTQFYSAITGNHQAILTPSKSREMSLREVFSDDSYISPLSNSVLAVNVADLQATLSVMPDPVLVPTTITNTTTIDSTVYKPTQTFCPPFVDNSDTPSLPSPPYQSQTNGVHLTPTKSSLTSTTTGMINSHNLETLTVPDKVIRDINQPSPVKSGFIFARKSLPPGTISSLRLLIVVIYFPFWQITQVSILGQFHSLHYTPYRYWAVRLGKHRLQGVVVVCQQCLVQCVVLL